MKNTHKGIIISLAVLIIVIAGGAYYIKARPAVVQRENMYTVATGNDQDMPSQEPVVTTPSTEVEVTSQTQVTILVPENLAAYRKAMNVYSSDGGVNPSKTWSFVKKTVDVAPTDDVIRASAEAAAELIPPQGGPAHASVAYLKIKEKTVYVMLNIDLDGWAGVSFSRNQIHPVVERTLLQFPQIQSVVFNVAPGDDLKSIR